MVLNLWFLRTDKWHEAGLQDESCAWTGPHMSRSGCILPQPRPAHSDQAPCYLSPALGRWVTPCAASAESQATESQAVYHIELAPHHWIWPQAAGSSHMLPWPHAPSLAPSSMLSSSQGYPQSRNLAARDQQVRLPCSLATRPVRSPESQMTWHHGPDLAHEAGVNHPWPNG